MKTIKSALREDVGTGDVTTKGILNKETREKIVKAIIISKEKGVIAGLDTAKKVFLEVDSKIIFQSRAKEGELVSKGTIIANIKGKAESILLAERTALNFIQHLSGIATTARMFCDKVQKYNVVLLDTRKTTPGLRTLEKDAARQGGVNNHRKGLYDMVLIKDNHLKLAKANTTLSEKINELNKKRFSVEIEAKTLSQVKRFMKLPVDIILLDNMTPKKIKEAVKIVGGKKKLEISGGISLKNIASYAKMGVDRISIGSALTLSSKAMDISLDIE